MKNVSQIVILATAFFLIANLPASELTTSVWGEMPDGREVRIFTLTNDHGTTVRLAEYGALLVSIDTTDRDGKPGRITLSYDSLEEALRGGVFGSVIGRFANRIDGGGFSIDGVRHDLASVHPETGVHIHGGKTGFHRQLWNGEAAVDRDGTATVTFSLTSPDGHEGYPGTVVVTATYRLSRDNALTIHYHATTDRSTHLNLTNHAYFNLAGEGTIAAHRLQLRASAFLEIDERNIPTGKLLETAGTPFDFTGAARLGDRLPEFASGGLDHCFVIAGDHDPEVAATLTDPESGRVLSVRTSKPGVQIYTANHFRGNPYPRWGGICFETQFYPNAPNETSFPSSLLRPGQRYDFFTEFRFGLVE